MDDTLSEEQYRAFNFIRYSLELLAIGEHLP
jgi:hypothetical protein